MAILTRGEYDKLRNQNEKTTSKSKIMTKSEYDKLDKTQLFSGNVLKKYNENLAKQNLDEKQKKYDNALKQNLQNIKDLNLDYSLKPFSTGADKTLKTGSTYLPTAENREKIKNNQEIINNSSKVQESRKATTDALNDLRLAQYQYDVSKEENHTPTLWDKTVGVPIRATKDLLSMFSLTDNPSTKLYKDDNGNKSFLPTVNELRQQNVSNSYETKIGKLLSDITYNGTKILGSSVLPGGNVVYWGDMFNDSFINTVNGGYNENDSLLYATLSTASELITSKLMGGLSKLVPGGSSELSKTINKTLSKVMKNDRLRSVLSNALSEGSEEFVQEYVDLLNRNLVLGENNKFDLKTFENALYSGLVGMGTGGISGAVNVDVNTNNEGIINKTDSVQNANVESNNIHLEDVLNIENNLKQINTISDRTNVLEASPKIENYLSKKSQNAKNYFGITNDFSKAGFILENGEMLDFSDGYIQNEHSEIENVVGNIDDYIIFNGVIRIGNKQETALLEVGKMPTNNQLYKIMDFADKIIDKPLTIELKNGKNNITFKYNENINSVKVKNDIKNYYETNTIPKNVEILNNSNENNANKILTLKEQQNALINSWIENGFIEDINDKSIDKWISNYPTIFPNGKILSNIKQNKGNIPINKQYLNKYSSVREIFDNEANNYDGEINVRTDLDDVNNIDLKNIKIDDAKNLAVNIFNKYNNKKVFNNNGNLIEVSKSGIEESVKKIFSNHTQRNMLKEHLKVFSDLGDIIEHANLVNQATELKDRDGINYWNYYFDGLIIDNKTYSLEFDVRSMDSGSNQYRVQRLEEKKKKVDISTGDASNNTRILPAYETSTHVNNDTIKPSKSQIVPLPNTSNMQKNTNNELKGSKILNPIEISKLRPKDANTTPTLPDRTYNKNNDGNSHFFENIRTKTNMLNENQKNVILNEDDVKYYDKITNKVTLEKAFDRLNENGATETNNWFAKDSEKATAIDVAEGWILLKQYADKNNADGMVAVAKKLRDIGTKAGQTVQAFNIMERMSPEGMVKYAQSELSEAYDKMVKNKSREWIEKYRDDFDLKPEEVSFIMKTMQEISKMEDGYEKRVKLAEIQKVMTDKLPPERGAGIKAWMRISMLFNPKTHVRNVMGNAVITPVNYFSDLFSGVVDKAISKKTGIRTIGKTDLKSYLKGFKTGLYQSYNDFKKGINTRNIQGNRFEISQGKSFNDNTKLGKSLNRVDSLLSFMLDAGDRGFYEASFTNSINNQLVLNNTTKVTQEMIDIATQEALSRTWQDNNGYTKFVLQTRSALNKINIKGYGLGDVLIPFAKTPANLTKAIVDYSPAGLVKTIIDGNNLKKSLSNGQYNAQLQHQFIQELGKATAGTMLYILGYALAKAGVVSGESDDDKDTRDFMKNTLGVSSYSIKIGNKSFTYDWAQPISAPLSIMANYVQKQKENASILENAISSLDEGFNIILQQSFFESINNVFSETGEVPEKIIEELLGLPSRAIPTLMKQIVDLTDSTQRQSFEYDQPLNTAVNKVVAKIPGLSYTLTPAIDTMGREIRKYGGKNNIFNVFLNPANVNTENISESAKEIYKIYKSTGDKTIMPRAVAYYINQNNEKIILSTEQRKEYQQISGKIIEDNVKSLKTNSNYKKMSDVEKASVINNIVNYSYNKARKDVLNIDMSNTYNKVNEWVNKGGKVYEYYANKEENDFSLESPSKYSTMTTSNINYYDYLEYQKKVNNIKDQYSGTENANVRKQKVFEYINGLNYNKNQKIILFKMLGGYSIKDYQSSIFSYINNLKISKNEKQEIWKYLYGE